jgi:formylglycine-generating enzyme required for sulfatase activity
LIPLPIKIRYVKQIKNKKIMKTKLLFPALLLVANMACANNLAITSVSTVDATHLTFTVSWDNSWYITPIGAGLSGNYDAAWIFVKGQDCSGDKAWDHVNLTSGTSSNGNMSVTAGSDNYGVYVNSNTATYYGSVSTTVTLTLVSSYPNWATMNWQVFGIEMVYVPSGNFYLGDNSSNGANYSEYSFAQNGGTAYGGGPTYLNYYQITTEASIAAKKLFNYNAGSGLGGPFYDEHDVIPAAFPKGYNAFYCMKYEVSQQQYAQFLNDLGEGAQITRCAAVSPVNQYAMTNTVAMQNRNTIRVQTAATGPTVPAVYTCDDGTGNGATLACNYISWGDLASYLCWAGLRPMTELEFEKACRGPEALPLTNTEYAWGSIAMTQVTSASITNAFQSTEYSTLIGSNGLANEGTVGFGPLRCGYAANGLTNRVTAGASYWGIMNMSDNVWEQCICIGFDPTNVDGGPYTPTQAQLTFTNANGSGNLSASGTYTTAMPNWPPETPFAGQVIVRGGCWEYSSRYCQISDRFYVNQTTETNTRVRRTGGRGVRTP